MPSPGTTSKPRARHRYTYRDEFLIGQKRAILVRQSFHCNRCVRSIRLTTKVNGFPPPDMAVFHHIKPCAKGGPAHIDNGEALCPHCHHWGRHGNNHKSWCKQCLSASQSGPGGRTAADRRHRGGRDHSTSQGRPDMTATTDGWVWVPSTGLAHLTGCGHLRRLARRAARTGGRLDTFSLPLPANTDWACLPTCMVCTKRQPGLRLPSGRARPGPLSPLRRTNARRRSRPPSPSLPSPGHA
jgi:hypothetical protein